jgi:hypothetical protein
LNSKTQHDVKAGHRTCLRKFRKAKKMIQESSEPEAKSQQLSHCVTGTITCVPAKTTTKLKQELVPKKSHQATAKREGVSESNVRQQK